MILMFKIILGVGIAGFLIMLFRKIPVLLNYPRHSFEEVSLKQRIQERINNFKERTGKSDFLHEAVMPKTEKFLRKFKILILKLDNFLAKMVSRISRKKKEKEAGDNGDLNLPM